MSMRSSIVTYLNTVASLTALVSTRIGFNQASHSYSRPYIVIQQVSGEHAHHMTAAAGKVLGRFQFDCVGSTLLEAMNVAEQLRQALDGYRGSMGDVFVSVCQLSEERDFFENPAGGEQIGISSVQQDYFIGWTVSVPSFA